DVHSRSAAFRLELGAVVGGHRRALFDESARAQLAFAADQRLDEPARLPIHADAVLACLELKCRVDLSDRNACEGHAIMCLELSLRECSAVARDQRDECGGRGEDWNRTVPHDGSLMWRFLNDHLAI